MAAPRYLKWVAGKIKMFAAAVTSAADSIVATDSTGKIDVSFLPTGVGPEVVLATATEALTAGNFVNIYDNGGVISCRKADATTNAKPAHGFVLANVSNGNVATIYGISNVNTALSGLTIGLEYYLSTTPGTLQSAAPAVAGNISQFMGVATKTTELQFSNLETVEIV
jgi:hypothetical protein